MDCQIIKLVLVPNGLPQPPKKTAQGIPILGRIARGTLVETPGEVQKATSGRHAEGSSGESQGSATLLGILTKGSHGMELLTKLYRTRLS